MELNFRDVKKAIRSGIGYVPENRKVQGLCLQLSVNDNLSMVSLRRRQTLGFIHRRAERRQAQDMVARLNIKTSSLQQAVMNLSGGNQQKVSIGKSLEDLPKVLILNEPTRGIDVGAKYEIYQIINQLAASGKTVIFISSDMPEILGMCDRVYVMNEGEIVGELKGTDITQENIMRAIMHKEAI